VAELAPSLGIRAACDAVGLAQASYYRRHRTSPAAARSAPTPHRDQAQPRALNAGDSPCWAVRSTRRRTLAHAGAAVREQLTAYRALVKALGEASTDPKGTSALEALEPLRFNNMMLVLDRHLVHRLRMVTGKNGDAVNEVELLAHSLIDNDAVLRATTSSGTRPRSRSSS